jgi:hypothetical protein
MRRVMRTLWPIKYWEPCTWHYLQGLRDFLFLLRVKEKIQLGISGFVARPTTGANGPRT